MTINPLPTSFVEDCEIKVENEIIEIDFDSMEHAAVADPMKFRCERNEAKNDDDDDVIIKDIFVKEEPRLHYDSEHPFEEFEETNQSSNSTEEERPEEDSTVAENLMLKCYFCPMKFNQVSLREEHHKSHTGGTKAYVCKICLKAFTLKNSLIRHDRTHAHEKPFECNVCEKQFTGKQHLLDHNKSHFEKKEYPCDKCLRVFKHYGLFSRHRKREHPSKSTKPKIRFLYNRKCYKWTQIPFIFLRALCGGSSSVKNAGERHAYPIIIDFIFTEFTSYYQAKTNR